MNYVHMLFGSQISILFIIGIGIVVIGGGVFHLRTGNPKSYGYVGYTLLAICFSLWVVSAFKDLHLVNDFTDTFTSPARAHEYRAVVAEQDQEPVQKPVPRRHLRHHKDNCADHDAIGRIIRGCSI